jgi:hypothetical protein
MFVPCDGLLIVVVRVEDPNTKLNKFVLIGWVPLLEGPPPYFFPPALRNTANIGSVAKVSPNTRKDSSTLTSLPLRNFSRYTSFHGDSDNRDITSKSQHEVKQISTLRQ